MRGGALPPALLCAALGLLIGLRRGGSSWGALAALWVAAALALPLRVPPAWADAVFAGLWTSTLATAALVHVAGRLDPRLFLLIAANAGLWCGLASAASGSPGGLAVALGCALTFLPAQFAAGRGWSLAVKVASSWLVAVALLAIGLSFVPTPGYKPDHMD